MLMNAFTEYVKKSNQEWWLRMRPKIKCPNLFHKTQTEVHAWTSLYKGIYAHTCPYKSKNIIQF